MKTNITNLFSCLGGALERSRVVAVLLASLGWIPVGRATAQPAINYEGANPNAGLLLSSNTLYGTTATGGGSGAGTVFAVNTDGTGFTILHTFNYSDGANPWSGLILSGNTLYGTTYRGGSVGWGNGTVFAINTDGTRFTNLYSFTGGNDGANPIGGLILSSNTLYGTTQLGGSSGNGTAFSLQLPAVDMPITVSGWNRDVIVESTATRPYTGAARPFDVPNDFALYEIGLPAGRRGLPPGRVFTSLVDGSTVFQFQPYNQNNVLQLSASTSSTGILTLETPAAYSSISVLAASANSYKATVGNLVLHFSDGTASPMFQFNNSDWFFQPNAAIYGFGRLRLDAWTAEDDGNSYPELYQTTINLAALGLTNHALVSVEFLDPSTDPRETTGIFAISGSLVPIQAPVVRCKHVIVSAEANCSAEASVDDGSFDPNAGGTITLVQSPPGPYPLGDTSVTLTVTDNRGPSNSCVATVTVVDTTPPSISPPHNMVIDATSHWGAVVTFPPAAASDNCSLAAVSSSPASGSTFAIGDTTVLCTATDAAGNQAGCSFTVHVKGAAEQINDLIVVVHGLGLQRGTAQSLLSKLEDAASDLARGNIGEACGDLHALLNQSKVHSGKKLTAAQADLLAAEITRIRAVLGCSEDKVSNRSVQAEDEMERREAKNYENH